MNHDEILKFHIEKFMGESVESIRNKIMNTTYKETIDLRKKLYEFSLTHPSLSREMIEEALNIPKRAISDNFFSYKRYLEGKWIPKNNQNDTTIETIKN